MRRSYRPASSANASASPAWACWTNSASESDIRSSVRESGRSSWRYQPIDTGSEIWLAAPAKLCLDRSIDPDAVWGAWHGRPARESHARCAYPMQLYRYQALLRLFFGTVY